MKWPTNSRLFLDVVSEQVAIKCGLLLTDFDILTILDQSPIAPWTQTLRTSESEWFTVRPEFLQDVVRVVRAGVGNLPDATPGDVAGGAYLDSVSKLGGDVAIIADAFSSVLKRLKPKQIDSHFAKRLSEECAQPLQAVNAFLLALNENLDRDSLLSPLTADWDGVQSLESLFSDEVNPGDADTFIDQRFLDYLAVNTDRLDKIHWRNFERLTAEFFKRADYVVSLGPGSKDGGVDVRIWRSGERNNSPPLILIQCKRLTAGQLVSVEYVKALWTDVHFEGADSGMVATTSRVSPAGKKVCQARGYNLSFAESEQVQEWAQTMWRYSWDTKRKSICVGEYVIPPVQTLAQPPKWILPNDSTQRDSEGR